jgi:CheY-like chemotaxis protein
MQEQLNQSQKMEAIGQLTGGVAHDFNNLLTVIIGNLDVLAHEIPEQQEKWRRGVQQALRASERAANLTQQLLAFARQQPLKPRPVEINQLVTRWAELIRRTLPESIAIRRIQHEEAVWLEVDENQLESALLNLAVNARDAMPGGGTLTIETTHTEIDGRDAALLFELEPGSYVVINVTDSGAGMSAEVLQRALDPFFTTKPMGQGTGLGLSQVFGFVKQSGGHLKIYSKVGEGTTIRIFLPRMHQDGVGPEATDETEATKQGSETILVVEDNDDVRTFTCEALRGAGYSVIEASDASAALRVLESQTGIDLLFTDIGLPGLNGRELVSTVQRRYPNVRVMFTSGYAQMPSATGTRATFDVPLLTKPFTRAQLLREIADLFTER